MLKPAERHSPRCACLTNDKQWRGTSNFHLGMYSPEGLGDGSPSVASRDEAPVGGLGETKSPKSRSSFLTLFTDFDCRSDQNLKISHNSPPDCGKLHSGWLNDP